MTFLAKRAVAVKASIRTRMLELAAGLDDIIPLGRGDPDFDTPKEIVDEGVRALNEGFHHYTLPAGSIERPLTRIMNVAGGLRTMRSLRSRASST